MGLIRFILLASLLAYAFGDVKTGSRETVVETSSGIVKGEIVETKWGSVIHFYGIPYARPPARFQPSRATLYPKSDEAAAPRRGQRETGGSSGGGTLSSRHAYHHHANPNIKVVLKDDEEATTKPPMTADRDQPPAGTPVNANYYYNHQACPQPSHLVDFKHPAVPTSDESLNEDCLRLNLYMPAVEEKHGKGKDPAKYPILVWIPGDGFSFGDAIHYDGSALAAQGEIIVVVVNYRVGVFGFLSTGDEKIRGNAGLSDIISALEWVHENAEEFNGDVLSLTVGGRFSGSMAISALISSPAFLRKREPDHPMLAQRIIMHGGIATNPWVIDMNPIKSAMKLMEITNCTRASASANGSGNNNSNVVTEESLKCLQELPTKTLLDLSMRVPEMFRPVIDQHLVIADPMESISYGVLPPNVEFLIGDNTGAGSICYQRHTYFSGDMLDKIQTNTITIDDLRKLMRDDLNTFYYVDDEGLAALVAHEYLNTPASMKLSYRSLYTHICGLLFLRMPTEITARYIARSIDNPVYRYELDGQFDSEPVRETRPVPKWLENAIGAEIIYLFPTNEHQMTETEEVIFNNLTTVYINFIREGTPFPEGWVPFDETEKMLVHFGPGGMEPSDSRYLDRDVEFWRDAMSKVVASYRKLASSGSEMCTEEVVVSEYDAGSNQTHVHSEAKVQFLCKGVIGDLKEKGAGINSALLGVAVAFGGVLFIQVIFFLVYLRSKLKENQLVAEFTHSG